MLAFYALIRQNVNDVIKAESKTRGFLYLSPVKQKLSLLPKAGFDEVNAQRVLEETYDVATLDVFWPMKETEVQAAGVLVDYIRSVQCQKNIQFRAPKCLYCSDFMQIDASTRRNLDLFVTDSHQGETLFSVLNKTQTGAGKRLLQNWLSMPLLNPQPIEERLDWTDFFLNDCCRFSIRIFRI